MKRGRNAPTSLTTVKKQRGTTSVVVLKRKQQQIVKPRIERKYFDSVRTGIAFLASTTTWVGSELDPTTLLCLFAPIQGDDIFNRQGRKVQVLQIKIQGQIGCPPQAGALTADVAAICRFHLVQDCQSNQTQLVPSQVFGTTTGTGEPTDMFQNPAFFGRYKVLKTHKVVLQNPNIANTSPVGISLAQQGLAHIWKMNVKFKKPVLVHYAATNSGTITDVIDNSFHVIGLVTDPDLAPIIAYRARTTFIDV